MKDIRVDQGGTPDTLALIGEVSSILRSGLR